MTDTEIIHETAKDGLDALQHGELTGVKSALESIRDRAESEPASVGELDVEEAGRYINVFHDGDVMLASFDTETGEFAVYDPDGDSEEPEYTARPDYPFRYDP